VAAVKLGSHSGHGFAAVRRAKDAGAADPDPTNPASAKASDVDALAGEDVMSSSSPNGYDDSHINKTAGVIVDPKKHVYENKSTPIDPAVAEQVVQQEEEKAIAEASKAGMAQVEEAAAEARQKWEAQLKNIQETQKAVVLMAREHDLEDVNATVQNEATAQEQVIDGMADTIKSAQEQVSGIVADSAKTYASSVAQNAAYNLTNPVLAAVYQAKAQVEALRAETLSYSEGASLAAKQLVSIATQAEALSNHLSAASADGTADEVQHSLAALLAQAAHSKKLASLSMVAIQDAAKQARASQAAAAKAKQTADKMMTMALAQKKQIDLLEQRARAAALKAHADASSNSQVLNQALGFIPAPVGVGVAGQNVESAIERR